MMKKNLVSVSVDGTDFRICEPAPFSPKWFSHKFRSAGLRYEIGVCLSTQSIVWLHGPFPAGKYTDQAIFNLKMIDHLLPNEKALADKGYGGPKIVHALSEDETEENSAVRYRALHECLNGRLKMFGCLNHRFRHSVEKHHLCLFSVAKLVQLELELRREK